MRKKKSLVCSPAWTVGKQHILCGRKRRGVEQRSRQDGKAPRRPDRPRRSGRSSCRWWVVALAINILPNRLSLRAYASSTPEGTAPTPPRAPIAPPLPAKPAKSTAHPLLLTIPEVILRRFGADLRHPRPEAPPGLVFLRGGGSGQPGLCLIGFGAFGASSSRSFLPVSSTAGQPGRSVPGALHLRAACHRRFRSV